MKYELPSTELIVIEENNYLKFGEYLNDMQCDDTANKLSLDDLEYVKKLQQENKRLKIQVSAREEVANKYKEVIEETRHYVEKECNDLLIGYFHNRFDTTEYYEKLLQILDKGVDK